MAQKRMFDKTITNSDDFIDMPDSSQNLYFHLSMNADDDGFVNNWKNILRMTGHKEDDLKVLIAKQYIIPFESGVVVIKHWRINNYLRKDRYTETNFKEEKEKLFLDDSMVYQVATNGEPRLDKIRLDNNINNNNKNKINNKESLYELVEKNFGRMLSPIEYEEISKWEDNELTRYAIKEAVLRRALNVKYINAILNDYKAKGIKSVKEIKKPETEEDQSEVFDYDWLEEEE